MAQQPTIKDWVLRELVTSQKMNEQVRDVHKNSFPQLATVRGTLPFLLATREVGLLEPPSEERILSSAGADPSWKTIGDLIVPGTVVESMLADDAVTIDKIKADNTPVGGRVLQAHASGMRWQSIGLQTVQLSTNRVPHPGRTQTQGGDVRTSFTWTTTDDLSSYILFYAVAWYPRSVEDINDDDLESVLQLGPVYRNALRSGSDYTGTVRGGGLRYRVAGGSSSFDVSYTPARVAGGQSRVDINIDFYGMRMQVF